MTEERIVFIGKTEYRVVISDEREALLAAKAAGKASIGILGLRQGTEDGSREDQGTKKRSADDLPGSQWLPCKYLVESLQDIDQEYLERVVRRTFGMPWIIARTDRLVIREFQPGDEIGVPFEREDTEADTVFQNRELLREYIRCQYGFYGYGIWAVTEKENGKIVGKAGVFNYMPESAGSTEYVEKTGICGEEAQWEEAQWEEALELGYHIFGPYRRMGYGKEACAAILEYVRRTMDCRVYAKTDASNEASVKLMKSLGFRFVTEKCTGEGQRRCLYCWN